MAVDDAILDSYATSVNDAPATLRLYDWKPAAVSLGRSQRFEGAFDRDYLRAEGIGLVRRPTGGLAVLHEFERTYSFCASLSTAPFDGGVLDTYEQISRALVGAMQGLGARAEAVRPPTRTSNPAGGGNPSCFQVASAHEIAVEGAKLIGSAQVRRRRAFLQHGTILIKADPVRLERALGRPSESGRFTDLESVLGRIPDSGELDRALVAQFESAFNVKLVSSDLTPTEKERATLLYTWKHCSLAWVRDGKDRDAG
jgi:lipoate-protein ligase A